MRIIIYILLFISSTTVSFGQIRDTEMVDMSKTVHITSFSSRLISKPSIAVIEFGDTTYAILFAFTTLVKNIPPTIEAGFDTLKFKLSNSKSLLLSHPYKDTIYYKADGNLYTQIFYFLDNRYINLLNHEDIVEILFHYYRIPFRIKVRNKTKNLLNSLFNY